jgi:hypothetical protein
MSVPSQPTDPQRRSTAQGAGTPRPPMTDAGLIPPSIPPALPPDPDLDEPEDDPPTPRRRLRRGGRAWASRHAANASHGRPTALPPA